MRIDKRLFTIVNVAAHTAYGLILQQRLGATEAFPRQETSPAKTGRSHIQSPVKQTQTNRNISHIITGFKGIKIHQFI